jgi:hypothetical protein
MGKYANTLIPITIPTETMLRICSSAENGMRLAK